MGFTITSELRNVSSAIKREAGMVGGAKPGGSSNGGGGGEDIVETLVAEYLITVSGTSGTDGPKSVRGSRAACEKINNTSVGNPGGAGSLYFTGCDVSYEGSGQDEEGETVAFFAGKVSMTTSGTLQAAPGGDPGGDPGGGTLSPGTGKKGATSTTVTTQVPKAVYNKCGDPIGPLFITKHLTKVTMVDYQEVDIGNPNGNIGAGNAGKIDNGGVITGVDGGVSTVEEEDANGNVNEVEVDNQFHNVQHDMGPAEFSSKGGARQQRTRSWIIGVHSPVEVENLGYYTCGDSAAGGARAPVMLELPDGTSVPSTVPIKLGPPIKVAIIPPAK